MKKITLCIFMFVVIFSLSAVEEKDPVIKLVPGKGVEDILIGQNIK